MAAQAAREARDRKEKGLALLERILTPTLAFHATPSRSRDEGIRGEGLLACVEISMRTGEVLQVTHGARYGDGRYLSPSLGFADSYGHGDASGKRQALLCLVALGRSERLPKDDDGYGLRGSDWHLCRCRRCEAPLCDGLECRLAEARAAVQAWEDECSATRSKAGAAAVASTRLATAMRAVEASRGKVAQSKEAEAKVQGVASTVAISDNEISKKQVERGEWLKARVAALVEERSTLRQSYMRHNFHSRISSNGMQYVVSQADLVLPLLLVTCPLRDSNLPPRRRIAD